MDLKHYVGASTCREITVSDNDTATKYGSGSIDVFATPAMISFIENTAMNLVQKYLTEKYTTVGTEINVKHLKATPIGKKVKCRVELYEVDGKKLNFRVEVKDDSGLVGKGSHSRFIVDIEKFTSNLQ